MCDMFVIDYKMARKHVTLSESCHVIDVERAREGEETVNEGGGGVGECTCSVLERLCEFIYTCREMYIYYSIIYHIYMCIYNRSAPEGGSEGVGGGTRSE